MHPSSDYMIPFSEIAFQSGEFVDLAYFEPYYLKDFIAVVPKKNIYG
jgi:tRNA threonylcarbamoyladenosine biosynthesis protein TsaB